MIEEAYPFFFHEKASHFITLVLNYIYVCMKLKCQSFLTDRYSRAQIKQKDKKISFRARFLKIIQEKENRLLL